ncbi:MAG: hypothetical protein AB7T49_00020 [Oligoflexales bacterium]
MTAHIHRLVVDVLRKMSESSIDDDGVKCWGGLEFGTPVLWKYHRFDGEAGAKSTYATFDQLTGGVPKICLWPNAHNCIGGGSFGVKFGIASSDVYNGRVR